MDTKPRATRSGGFMIELLGCTNRGDEAQKLAGEIKKLLPEGSRVYCPVKKGDILIGGIDPSVGCEEITERVSRLSGCLISDIRLGKLVTQPNGLNSARLTCPLTSAHALIALNKIKLGWSQARVSPAKERPLKCFRCLGLGHVRAECRDTHDRSNSCFKCGSEGHKATDCPSKKSATSVSSTGGGGGNSSRSHGVSRSSH